VRTVLRLSAGTLVEVFDGDGHIAEAEITQVDPTAVILEVGEVRDVPASKLALTLALATPKGDRADWLVEKATELGASRILWVTCQRSVVVPRKAGKKLERWLRIAEGAARQSRRAHTPTIDGPVAMKSLLELPADHRFVCDWAGPSLMSLAAQGDLEGDVIVVIGPEGGLTGHELEVLNSAGYNSVSLGTNVLRVETAALAVTATLMGGS